MGEISDTIKGKLKQALGALTGNNKLQREGKVDEAKGKVKGATEDVKDAVKDAVREEERTPAPSGVLLESFGG